MKEFVVMMLGAGALFILGAVVISDTLNRLSNGDLATGEAEAILIASSSMVVVALVFAVSYIRLQRKYNRSHQPPK